MTNPHPEQVEAIAKIINDGYGDPKHDRPSAAGRDWEIAMHKAEQILASLANRPADDGERVLISKRELNAFREIEDAAREYANGYCLDEAADEEGNICDEMQHEAAKRLCDALSDIRQIAPQPEGAKRP